MRAYDSHGRPPATPPRTMLKIVLYAAMEHNYSSRKIRSSCERDMNYIWLLNGAPAPSHFEIARFRSKRLTECADELFSQLVHHLHELGEIRFEHLFVDGTKIEANANKYSFVWKKSTNKYEARLDAKLEKLLLQLTRVPCCLHWKTRQTFLSCMDGARGRASCSGTLNNSGSFLPGSRSTRATMKHSGDATAFPGQTRMLPLCT